MVQVVDMALCPTWSPALGFAGASLALIMSCVGSAYGTGKAAMGISTIGVSKPEVLQTVPHSPRLHNQSVCFV